MNATIAKILDILSLLPFNILLHSTSTSFRFSALTTTHISDYMAAGMAAHKARGLEARPFLKVIFGLVRRCLHFVAFQMHNRGLLSVGSALYSINFLQRSHPSQFMGRRTLDHNIMIELEDVAVIIQGCRCGFVGPFAIQCHAPRYSK